MIKKTFLADMVNKEECVCEYTIHSQHPFWYYLPIKKS